MSCGIGIFVKTPSLSPVKTRLWPGLGRQCAEALYLMSAEAVASVADLATRTARVHAYWAVAEADALHTDAWLDLPHLGQGEGSLGQRMAQVYRALRSRHGAALLLGADAPQLRAEVLERAADWLDAQAPRLVIGRALDGGFWLFGGNTPLPDAAWLAARYSTADTCDEFVAAMRGHGDWLVVDSLRDVDTAVDLVEVHAALAGLAAPTPAQRRLFDWLDRLPSTAQAGP